MRRTFCSIPVLLLVSSAALAQDDPKQVLKDLGMRLVGDTAVLTDEADVTKKLGESGKFKKRLVDAAKVKKQAELNIVQKEIYLREAVQQRLQLNTQLNSVTDADQYNRIVGMLNTLGDQINLLSDNKKLDEEVSQTRQTANEAREAYVEHVLALRKAYDDVLAKYEELAGDETLKETLTALSADKPVKLGPSRQFATTDTKIKKIEETVLSETITLRKEGGVWYVTVVVNDAKPKDFVLDTGASILSLPFATAKELKVTPDSTSPEIQLSLADGRIITARQVYAKKVRVGPFTVENVECAVLPETAVAAEPLLGQSFLGKFSFSLDSDKGEIKMTQVQGEDPAQRGRK